MLIDFRPGAKSRVNRATFPQLRFSWSQVYLPSRRQGLHGGLVTAFLADQPPGHPRRLRSTVQQETTANRHPDAAPAIKHVLADCQMLTGVLDPTCRIPRSTLCSTPSDSPDRTFSRAKPCDQRAMCARTGAVVECAQPSREFQPGVTDGAEPGRPSSCRCVTTGR